MNYNTESQQHRTVVIVTDIACNILWVSEAFTNHVRVLGPSPVGENLVDWLATQASTDSLAELKDSIDSTLSFTYIIDLGGDTDPLAQMKLTCHPVTREDDQDSSYILVGQLPHFNLKSALPQHAGAFKAQYQGSSLTLERGQELFDRAEMLIRNDQLFRDRDLSISKLARKLNTNTQYLSQVINFLSGDRFSTYVNLARLEYAEQLLETGDYDERDIWWECGFGSYSAFYRAAHRHRGVSPSRLNSARSVRTA